MIGLYLPGGMENNLDLWYYVFTKWNSKGEKRMEIQRLEYFLKVWETESFSRAAEELFTSQSSVSKQIALLERDLGYSLFDRSGRKVRLTAQGAKALPLARKLLEEYRQLLQLGEEGRRLDIAVLPILGYYGVSERCTAFAQENPGLEVVFQEFDNSQIAQRVRNDQCDGAIWRVREQELKEWDYRDILTDELMLVVNRSNPLAGLDQPVALEAFRKEKFILLGHGTQLHRDSLEACARAGFHPDVLYIGSSAENIVRLIEKNAGAALLMGRVAQALQSRDLSVLRFRQAPRYHLIFAPSPSGKKKREVAALARCLQEG